MFNLLPAHGLSFPDNAAIISFGLGHVLFEIIEVPPEEEVPAFQQGMYGGIPFEKRFIIFRVIFGGHVYESRFIFFDDDEGEIYANLIPLQISAERKSEQ